MATKLGKLKNKNGDILYVQTSARKVVNAPSGTITAMDVQSALNYLDVKKVFKATTNASIGDELITTEADRDFSSDTGNWTGTKWTIGSGVYTHTAGLNNATLAGYTAVIGKIYQITIKITTTTVGTLVVKYGGASSIPVGQKTTPLNDYVIVLVATEESGLVLIPNNSWTGSVDNISIKEITSNSSIADYQNADGVLGVEVRTPNGTCLGEGVNALANNVTGNSNNASGANALFSNISGNQNTSIGTNSLYNNTTGNDNIAVGSSALYSNHKGEANTGLGTDSLYSNNMGSYNTAIGHSTLFNNTYGNYNTATGYRALYTNTTGNENTAVGLYALYRNTTGTSNVAVGTQSLSYNTTGNNNVAIGSGALATNSGGSNNIAFGTLALSRSQSTQSNIGVGASSLYANTTGARNCAIGDNSISNNTTGSKNIGMGDNAGRYIADGTTVLGITNNSVFLGADIKAKENSSSNEIVIGYNAIGNGSNTVTIGNTSITKTYLTGLVVGKFQITDTTDSASEVNVGRLKYVATSNASRVYMCMQTGATTYDWVLIKENTW